MNPSSSKSFIYLILMIFLTILQTGHCNLSLHSERIKILENYFRKFVGEHSVPCIQVGVNYNGTTFQWLDAFGSGADIENHIPCTNQTMLHVASVSKAIGSSLIAHLVEQGKLEWDVDISTYLPLNVFPKPKHHGLTFNITLRQLITHQSGIRNSNNKDYMHDWEFRVQNSTDLLQWFRDDQLEFEPGTGFCYSNLGWATIGAIVESVEKRSYHLVLEEFMSQMIGMPTATSDTRERLIPNRGQQYYIIDHEPHYAPIQDLTRPFPHWPGGGVIANVQDLLIYGQKMLQSYKISDGSEKSKPLLNQSTIQEMWTYQNGNVSVQHVQVDVKELGHSIHNIQSKFVMGWERRDFPNLKHSNNKQAIFSELIIISHTGQVESVNAKLAIMPQYDLVIAVILNRGELMKQMDEIPVDTFYYLFHD